MNRDLGKMGKKSIMKRQAAPAFWEIPRKGKRFSPRASPGTHPSSLSYPLGVVLRDVLKVVNSMREVEHILNSGDVKVDGVVRRDPHFPVGLMDVIELVPMKKSFRMLPKDGVIVRLVEIPDDEKAVKLCKVMRKVSTKGDKLQYGFHDGRTMIDDLKLSVHDSCLLSVPEIKVNEKLKLEEGSSALVISGENAGVIGKVQEIREGTFILPKRVLMGFEHRQVELPVDMIMVVGKDKPLIRIS